MEARPAATGSWGGGQNGAGADPARIGTRIFQTRDTPPATPDRGRPPLAPQSPVRRRPGLY